MEGSRFLDDAINHSCSGPVHFGRKFSAQRKGLSFDSEDDKALGHLIQRTGEFDRFMKTKGVSRILKNSPR